jgi:hypothetical protein
MMSLVMICVDQATATVVTPKAEADKAFTIAANLKNKP